MKTTEAYLTDLCLQKAINFMFEEMRKVCFPLEILRNVVAGVFFTSVFAVQAETEVGSFTQNTQI